MSIPAERLKEGSKIFVRGKILFSRLAKLIEGPALQRSIEQARKRGALYPIDVPHTTITLIDPQVLPQGDTPTVEEQFIQERFYDIKSGDNVGHKAFNLNDRSGMLPIVFEPIPADEQDGTGSHRQVILTSDLDTDLDVTLMVDVFKPKNYEKRGIGIGSVILNEPIRYYGSNINNNVLSKFGITLSGPVRRVNVDEARANVADTPDESENNAPQGTTLPSVTTDDGYVLPAPTPMVPAPVAQPVVQSAPAPAPVDNSAEIARLEAELAKDQAAQAQVQPETEPQPMTPEQQMLQIQQQAAAANAQDTGGSPFDVTITPGIGIN